MNYRVLVVLMAKMMMMAMVHHPMVTNPGKFPGRMYSSGQVSRKCSLISANFLTIFRKGHWTNLPWILNTDNTLPMPGLGQMDWEVVKWPPSM
jgi:hypothetical protein